MKENLNQKFHVAGTLYLVPFVLTLFARTYYLGDDVTVDTGEESVYSTIMFGFSYLLAALLLIPRASFFIEILFRVWPYFFYAMYAATTAFSSSYPEVVVLRVGHMVGTILVTACAGLWACDRKSSLLGLTTRFIFVAEVVSLLFVLLLPERALVHSEWTSGGALDTRWLGVTGHPNLLGAIALIGMWLSFASFNLERGRQYPLISVGTIFFSLVMLKGSDSRTAQMGFMFLIGLKWILSGVKFDFAPRVKPDYSRPLMKVIFVLSLGVIMAIALANMDTIGFTARDGATDVFSDRPYIWGQGVKAIIERPMGWSYDLFRTYWDNHDQLDLFYHFHNGYLDIAVRGGIIAESAFLLILVRMFSAIRKMRIVDPRLSKEFMLFFLTNVFYNLTETSFDRESSLWLMLMTVWLCAETVNWRYSGYINGQLSQVRAAQREQVASGAGIVAGE